MYVLRSHCPFALIELQDVKKTATILWSFCGHVPCWTCLLPFLLAKSFEPMDLYLYFLYFFVLRHWGYRPVISFACLSCFSNESQRLPSQKYKYHTTWVCLKIVSTPKPNGFADHYPYEMAISLGIYPTFSDKPTSSFGRAASFHHRKGVNAQAVQSLGCLRSFQEPRVVRSRGMFLFFLFLSWPLVGTTTGRTSMPYMHLNIIEYLDLEHNIRTF